MLIKQRSLCFFTRIYLPTLSVKEFHTQMSKNLEKLGHYSPGVCAPVIGCSLCA